MKQRSEIVRHSCCGPRVHLNARHEHEFDAANASRRQALRTNALPKASAQATVINVLRDTARNMSFTDTVPQTVNTIFDSSTAVPRANSCVAVATTVNSNITAASTAWRGRWLGSTDRHGAPSTGDTTVKSTLPPECSCRNRCPTSNSSPSPACQRRDHTTTQHTQVSSRTVKPPALAQHACNSSKAQAEGMHCTRSRVCGDGGTMPLSAVCNERLEVDHLAAGRPSPSGLCAPLLPLSEMPPWR